MASGDAIISARALRELARWIVRDGVDGDHLNRYMRHLLSARLVELPASCRREVTLLAEHFSGLPAREVGSRLRQRAQAIEQSTPPPAAHAAGPARTHTASKLKPTQAPRPSRPLQGSASRSSSSAPELIGAVVFSILGVAILLGWPAVAHSRPMVGGDDVRLRFITAAGCVLTGVMYACEAARQAWQKHQ